MLKMVHSMVAKTDQQQNRLFFKIAVTMGATIGISEFIFIYNGFAGQIPGIIGTLALLVQQCVIVILMCSRNISQICKERFSTTGSS